MRETEAGSSASDRTEIEANRMEVRRLVKEKKFWIASILVAWAAGLQGHMMWLQRQEAFKQKFGHLNNEGEVASSD